jgi:hypothetical protein
MISILLASLAVYKALQFTDSILPREAMPWVKILASIVLGYVAGLLIGCENLVINGLAIASLSGTVHAVHRLLTLSGDAAHRKSLR